MQRALNTMFLLMLFSLAFAAGERTELIIGTGSVNNYLPINTTYSYSYSQSIYLQSEINIPEQQIEKLSFYWNGAAAATNSNQWVVYMGHTNATRFANTSSWLPLSELTQVFAGVLTINATAGWKEIILDAPFTYNNTQNLVIAVDENRPQYDNYAGFFHTTASSGVNRSLRAFSDTVNIDPSNPPSGGQQTLVMAYPNVKLEFNLIPSDPIFAIAPDEYHYGEVNMGDTANQEFVITNYGTGALNIQSISLTGNAAFELGVLPTLPATLMLDESISFGLDFSPNNTGQHNANILIIESGGTAHNVTVTGMGVREIRLGDGSLNARFPLDFHYQTSLYQVIFSAAELNYFTGLINGMKIFNQFNSNLTNRAVKIWMGSTWQTDLAQGWIPASELTLVFDGVKNFPYGQNAINFTFPEAFSYINGRNLVVMVQRPMENQFFNATDYFKCDPGVFHLRALNFYSDEVAVDPNNPPAGSHTSVFPKISFVVEPVSIGAISGTVRDENNLPLSGVSVYLADYPEEIETNADGEYIIPYLVPGEYHVTFSKHTYQNQTITVQVEADEMLTLDVNMQLLPGVMVCGRIIAYDTGGGLANAFVRLSGFANFLSSTDSEGYFSFPYVFAGESYAYLVSAVGYGSQVGNIAVGINDYYIGNIMLYETLYAPNSLIAGESENYDAVELNWNAPDPSAMELREGFEGEDFPPSGWSQIITNTSAASPQGVYPTWCRFGAVNTGMALVEPPEGSMQAGLWWMVAQQDEWLQTPAFICPPAAYLKFDTYATYGSNNGDHYYVKVSADGGESWAVLWDASAFPTATNYYENMISIDISNYAGQEILLAFHATDGGTYEGLWHPWFIDDIYIGNMAESAWQSRVVNANREIVGYRVWRLTPAEEQNEAAWTLLTPESINNTSYTDTDWDSLPYESYKWAVKAVYSGDLHSSPAFSNTLVKTQLTGTVVGMVRRSNGQGIPAAVVNCSNGESTTTNNSGAYSMILPIGTYSFSASANGYHPLSHDEIAILANQNITLNFNLIPLANQDDVQPVAATLLRGNYPNPFNPETIISYELKDAASVRLEIYNLKGQLVRRLVNESQASGRYRIVFDAKDEHQQPLPSGIYLYRLNAGEYRKTRKMMLLQ